ncbi:MAG: adenosylmethionine decarboxylase [Candidatus Lokiarchaeota archaeon]|nr:adenosylmethionine decarboxylase [Candidatus Lokiarchaeota archaeon]
MNISSSHEEKKDKKAKNPYFWLQQVVGDYINCKLTKEQWRSPTFFKEAAFKAVAESNSKVLSYLEHEFSPQGYTILMILAESSLTLHCWPEERFISVEIFTCGKRNIPKKGLDYLKNIFQPENYKIKEIER